MIKFSDPCLKKIVAFNNPVRPMADLHLECSTYPQWRDWFELALSICRVVRYFLEYLGGAEVSGVVLSVCCQVCVRWCEHFEPVSVISSVN